MILCLFSSAALRGQDLELLADLNLQYPGARSEYMLAKLGIQWVFRASSPAFGEELFVCSPPSYAVSLLRDINPGHAGSDPDNLTVVGNKLFFVANDGEHGDELWITDGTTAGTVLVADIRPGPAPGVVRTAPRVPFVALGNQVFLRANDGAPVHQLWKSDGTASGTDVVFQAGSWASTEIRGMAALGQHLYFTSFDLLMRTDGTPAGTVVVRQFPGSFPSGLQAVGSTLFFVGPSAQQSAFALWKSDGTTAGTVVVLDVFPRGFVLADLTAFGAYLFFTANDGVHGYEPWISDGTAAGTAIIADLAPGSTGSYSFRIEPMVLGNRVLFAANDGVSGLEPWVSDGTAGGTKLLRDINPGVASSLQTNVGGIDFQWRRAQAGGGRCFFAADDGVHGFEPWSTDGTAAGTQLVADLMPGGVGSRPGQIVADAAGTAGLLADSPAGGALWIASGNSASLVTTIASRSPYSTDGSTPRDFTVLGGDLLFAASASIFGVEPHRTDGTPAGTGLLRDICPGGNGLLGSSSSWLVRGVRVGGSLYFTAQESNSTSGFGLWKTDGTTAGTVKVRALEKSGSVSENYGYWLTGAAFRDHLWFVSVTLSTGYWSLWVTSGTSASSTKVLELGRLGNQPTLMRVGKYVMVFSGAGVLTRITPDGGPTPITQIASIGGTGNPTVSLVLGSRLLFVVPGASNNDALWQTDGTTTSQLLALGPWPSRQLVRFRDRAYFMASTPAAGNELWSTDGTAAGTAMVADLVPGAASSTPHAFTVAGDRLFFGAEEGTNAVLWVSDGTAAGTTKVATLTPGPGAGAGVGEIVAAGSRRVVFTGSEPSGLWQSDGSPGGTRFWSAIGARELVAHRGNLVFQGYDLARGQEPFVLRLDATAMSYGLGCAESGFPPSLEATDPVLGAPLTYRVRDALPSKGAFWFLGFPRFPELQLGNDCALAFDVSSSTVVVPFTTDASGGFASPPIAVPADPSLVGQQLAMQVAVGPTGNLPLLVDLSNGVLLTFGK